MFSLNKSLAKLKAALVEEGLAKKLKADKAANNDTNEKSETTTVVDVPKSKSPIKKSKVNKAQSNEQEDDSGVVMIRNFPHGFYEKQMFDYFSQFGQVTRLKIVRSRKTGKPRKYGFIEFKYEDVAKIAAETMNNYLMFNQIVKCVVLPKEKINKDLFKNWNRPFISSVKTHKMAHNQTKTAVTEYDMLRKRLRRIHNMEALLKAKGINFEPVLINRPTDLKSRIESAKKTMIETTLPSPKTIRPLMIPARKPSKGRKLVLLKFSKLRAAAKKSNLVKFK